MREKLLSLDWNKWINNTLVFTAPVAILYLIFIQAEIRKDGIQWEDFKPSAEVAGAMVLYLTNVLLDFFKKYRQA